ncbi:MAG: Gldg family protein [Pseudomonadota bacterium]
MNVIFQCLGITGGILILSGMLAFAFTHVSTWFFWGLLIAGCAFLVAFVVTTLSRLWQRLVAILVAVNLPWIFLIAGKEWAIWKLSLAGGVSVLGLFAAGFVDAGMLAAGIGAGVVGATFAGVVFAAEKSGYGYGVLACAFLHNGIFVYLGRIALKQMFEKRSLRYGTTAVIYSVLSIGVIIVANVMSTDFHWQKDFTENQVNTLAEQSVKAVEGLKEPLRITAFFDDRNEKKPALKELFGMYGYRSKKVETKFVDPDKERLLAEKHKAKDGDIVIEYGTQSYVTQAVTEEGMTQAILKVARTVTPTACFTKGHGELGVDAAEDSPRSASYLKKGLENEGIKVKSIESVVGGVPAGCSMIVIAGPLQRFTDAEAGAVGKYLDGGGKGFFLLDPRIPDPRMAAGRISVQESGLENVTKKWGIELGRDFILEAHLELLRGVVTGLTVQAFNYGSHPIVDPLKGKQTVFDAVRSLKKAEGFAVLTTELIQSAGNNASWTKEDVDSLFRRQEVKPGPKDRIGPIPFAMATEKETDGKKTQLVVIGDSDFMMNGNLRSYEFNFDLTLNVFNWLGETVEQISIRPKQLRTSMIDLTPEQSNMVFYVAVVTIPMLVLIFGINLWWYRRRKG